MIDAGKEGGMPLEAPFINVEKRVAENVLSEISENPESAFMAETVMLQREDSVLNNFLFARQKTLQNDVIARDYIEGSVWMYKLLKAQAADRGGSLPKLKKDVSMTFFEDLIQDSSLYPGEDTGEAMKRSSTKLEAKEEGIKFYTGEICKYKINPTALKGGMAEVYFLLLKAAKTNSLNKLFGQE